MVGFFLVPVLVCAAFVWYAYRLTQFKGEPVRVGRLAITAGIVQAATAIPAAFGAVLIYQFVNPGDNWYDIVGGVAGGFNLAAAPLVSCAVAIAGYVMERRRRRRNPLTCHQCGYNLTGNVSGRCPECGTSVYANQRGASRGHDQPSLRDSGAAPVTNPGDESPG